MTVYKTGLYQINFSCPDSFAKFQSAMGFEPDYHWNEADRLEFLFNWPFFEQAYEEAFGGYCIKKTTRYTSGSKKPMAMNKKTLLR